MMRLPTLPHFYQTNPSLYPTNSWRKSVTAMLLLASLGLSGCTHLARSDYRTPSIDIPTQWQTVALQQDVHIDPWWKKFADPKLNQLIDQVLVDNNDLALASLTLRKARLQAGLATDDSYPQLSASGDASTSKNFNSGDKNDHYSTSLGISYEVDLWGRVSAQRDSAQWLAQASAQDREATAQSLVATTAGLYWQIAYLNDSITLTQTDIDDANTTLQLIQRQYRSGSVSKLDLLEAQRNLASVEATLNGYQQQRSAAQNSLAILFNQPPQDLALAQQSLPTEPMPDIAPGLPADLLIRRPDVRASLYQLKSALADRDATYAGYLPELTLTGSIGSSSQQLNDLLRNPIGTLGANLMLPFLQWNQMQLNKKIADIDYQSAVINYRQTLYTALKEVDDALSARQNLRYQAEKLTEQYTSAEQAERIYASRYKNGAITILDWINAQQNMRDAHVALLQNQYNQYLNQATLYQTLGGRDIALPLEE